ncbi:MAG: alkaline phosphatase family protein, partial [Petrotogales bacterium]
MIIGLDSVSYSRMKTHLDELPNMRNIVEQGCFSLLSSTIPCSSAPAWVSFATGVPPEKHGIYGFYSENHNIYNANDVKQDYFWKDIEKKIIMNIPLTYPPSSDIMISGLVTPIRVSPRKNEYKEMVRPEKLYKLLHKNRYEIT